MNRKHKWQKNRDEEITNEDSGAAAVEVEAKLRPAKAQIEEISQITRHVRGDNGEGSEGEEEREGN
ncbi:hypothetical protein QJS10_CPB11g01778 [Acorus calamus]|uniref:Uncharacterized protein n=1 Tax=Acorus calamus TaxID=4465 RepID=A0AAV9DSX1_ACOCL|nr:hypothetical protein QJS10_CPB11g01778 [Acorus calamus]